MLIRHCISNPGYLNEISFRLRQKLWDEHNVGVHVSVMTPTLHEAGTKLEEWKTGSLLYFRCALNGEYLMKYKKR